MDAFEQAFYFYNFARRPKPSSTYDDKSRRNITDMWSSAAQKRNRFTTLSSFERNSKRRKSEQSENKTNVEMQDVETLRTYGFNVETPVDFDAVNVLVPPDWVCMLHYDW